MMDSSVKKLAIYDLIYCPVTFDFVNFLAAARLFFAKNTGNTSFDLLIIASDFRKKSPRDLEFDDTLKTWRLYNLILPIITCSPFIKSFSVSKILPKEISRDAFIYPPGYKLDSIHSAQHYFGSAINKYYFGQLHPACFQAPKPALNHAKNLFKANKKKVLISPRYSHY